MAAITVNTRYDPMKKFHSATGNVYGPEGPLAYGTKQNLGTPADNDYLTRYPSVAAAISAGQYGLTSGYDHYMTSGKGAGMTYNFDLNTAAAISPAKKKYLPWIIGGVLVIGAFLLWKNWGKVKKAVS